MAAGTLIGRDAELKVLGELIDGASEVGAALLLLGEPGIGKSELVMAVVDMGRAAGFQVLETTGVESETQVPFAGLHQMLRPLRESIESLPARQRDGLLAAFGEAEGPTPEPSLVAMAALNLLAVHETLGDLAIDSTRNEGLRDTARVFLQTGGSYTATAERLFLHRNTAQYRVRRAEEVRGRPLRDGRLDVELALLACHWLKGAVLKPP